MCEYVIKLENDIKYYNNGNWVPKEESENLIGTMQIIPQEN